MTQGKPVLVDREYFAEMFDCSRDSVRKNEERWGIIVAKVYLNKRLVRYKLLMALRILRKRGFLE